MHNALCEYKNTEGNCFLIIMQHVITDIIDITTVNPHNTQKLTGGETCGLSLTLWL